MDIPFQHKPAALLPVQPFRHFATLLRATCRATCHSLSHGRALHSPILGHVRCLAGSPTVTRSTWFGAVPVTIPSILLSLLLIHPGYLEQRRPPEEAKCELFHTAIKFSQGHLPRPTQARSLARSLARSSPNPSSSHQPLRFLRPAKRASHPRDRPALQLLIAMSAEPGEPSAHSEPDESEPEPDSRVVKEAYIRLTDVIFEWSKVLDPHQVRSLDL